MLMHAADFADAVRRCRRAALRYAMFCRRLRFRDLMPRLRLFYFARSLPPLRLRFDAFSFLRDAFDAITFDFSAFAQA